MVLIWHVRVVRSSGMAAAGDAASPSLPEWRPRQDARDSGKASVTHPPTPRLNPAAVCSRQHHTHTRPAEETPDRIRPIQARRDYVTSDQIRPIQGSPSASVRPGIWAGVARNKCVEHVPPLSQQVEDVAVAVGAIVTHAVLMMRPIEALFEVPKAR